MDKTQSSYPHIKVALFSLSMLLSSALHADHYLNIAYSSPPDSIPFWQQMKQAIYQETEKEHIFLINYSANDFTSQRQALPLKNSLKQPIDGYIIAATSNELSQAIDDIAQARIPVVAIDTPIDHAWVKPQILTDNKAASKMAADYLHQVIQEKQQQPGRILLITGDERHANAQDRAQGFIEALTPFGYQIDTFYTQNWSTKLALTTALTQLKKHPYQGAYTTYSGATHALGQAQQYYQQTELVHIGFDPTPTIDKMLAEQQLAGVIQQDGKTMAQLGIRYLKARIAGENVPDTILVPALLITEQYKAGS